jgi:hypothetical protein
MCIPEQESVLVVGVLLVLNHELMVSIAGVLASEPPDGHHPCDCQGGILHSGSSFCHLWLRRVKIILDHCTSIAF